MNAQEPQSAPGTPILPGAAIEVAMQAFLAKKIELRSDGDGPLEDGSHQAIAVLAAIAAAAPFLQGYGSAKDADEPRGISEAAVRAAAEAAYESVRTLPGRCRTGT